VVSAWSFQASRSVFSGQSDGSVLSWQSRRSVRGYRDSGGRLRPVPLGIAAVVVTAAVAATWVAAGSGPSRPG
jgi:hypothetical protein